MKHHDFSYLGNVKHRLFRQDVVIERHDGGVTMVLKWRIEKQNGAIESEERGQKNGGSVKVEVYVW